MSWWLIVPLCVVGYVLLAGLLGSLIGRRIKAVNGGE